MFNFRNSKGVVSLFVAALALVVLMIGFFGAEIWYASVANSHIRNMCDAASMAAAARIVSSRDETMGEARAAAKALAIDVMRHTTVMGESMGSIAENTNIEELKSLPVGKAVYSVKYYDQFGRESPQNGKRIRVQAAFCTAPFSNKLLGLSPYLVKSEGNSSAAKLDMTFCLDTSLSMATDTPVAFVRRDLDPTMDPELYPPVERVRYNVLRQGIANKMPVWGMFGSVEPLYLHSYDQNTGEKALKFDPSLRGTNVPEKGGMTDVGVPPAGSSETTTVFTDRVIVGQSAPFDNPIVCVEAARGNLNSEDLFKASGAKYAFARQNPPISITPSSDFKKNYERATRPLIQPFNNAKTEIKDFFKLLENNTDSHVSIVPFSDGAPTMEGQKRKQWRVAKDFKTPGNPPDLQEKKDYEFGKVELNQTDARFGKVKEEMDKFDLFGGTDIPRAVREATKTLSGNGTRSEARKVILLFTDGDPTSYEDPIAESIAAAEEAGAKGITLFAVGYLHGGANSKAEQTLKSMVERNGLHGKAFIVRGNDELHEVFRVLARELVTLEH